MRNLRLIQLEALHQESKRATHQNRFEKEGLKFQLKVRQGFLKSIRQNPKRWIKLKIKNQTPTEQIARGVAAFAARIAQPVVGDIERPHAVAGLAVKSREAAATGPERAAVVGELGRGQSFDGPVVQRQLAVAVAAPGVVANIIEGK